ncbi:hypothetical protein [Streptomyces tauricus]|uniref:hypothetical protein n=1 Tax=Streptomyces tauricus TaxID=68274 RepID=UPI0022431CD8|nr:hypothetical protein [Streptomyces tauricus]MCW8103386.1 hypothetical protein [Streptomyces tauricus]
MAVGDVDGDGHTGLSTAAHVGDQVDEGALSVLAGSAQGLGTRILGKAGLSFTGHGVVADDGTGEGSDDLVVGTAAADGPDDFLFRMLPGTAFGLGTEVAHGGPVQPETVAALADSTVTATPASSLPASPPTIRTTKATGRAR